VKDVEYLDIADDDTVKTIESAAAGDIDESTFAEWVARQIV
jgi:hypothetical protein